MLLVKISAAAMIGTLTTATAAATAPYYKNRHLRVVINYSPGGPTDIEGRLFARHIGKHVDGNPKVTVHNMDGAGGAVGNNYLGVAAPKDGTTIGYLSGAAWQAAFSPEEWPVPLTSYGIIAYQSGTSMHYVRSAAGAGIKRPSDLPKARGLILGGLRATQSKDLTSRLVLDMLGVEYKYVTGYKGTSNARLALQQGEIDYLVESAPSYRGVVEPTMVKQGIATPLYFDPGIHSNGEYYVPSTAQGLDGMQPFHVVYEQIKGKPPSGQLWEAYKTILGISDGLQRLIVAPPGTPQEAVRALREAVAKLNKDKEFEEEATRTFGFVPRYETGARVAEEVHSRLRLSPEMRAFIEAYMGKASR
jgi:tripartite-type tricarboxylate transporter receptor subunit TctC